jgi:ribosome-binding factor A
MAREFFRSDRVGDALQRLLSEVIRDEIRDPRAAMVNVNAVDVVRDLSVAKVYITVVGGDEVACEQAAEVLNNAAGFLRSHVSRALTMRSSPRLQFFYDVTTHRAQALSGLIDKAIAADKSKQPATPDNPADES